MESELLIKITRTFNAYRDADADLTDTKINCAILEHQVPSPSLLQLREAYTKRDLALQRQITAASRLIELLPPTLQYPAEEYQHADRSPLLIQ